MSYSPEYYKNKREELDRKFFTAKDQLIQDMFNLLNRFSENQKDLQGRFADLMREEEESKKKTEEENKKKIDQAVKK
jgi:hypothetical protein